MDADKSPPASVVFVARTYWLTGAVILAGVGVIHAMTWASPVLAFQTKAYAIGLGLGALYLLAGTAIWFGWSVGSALHAVCTILFLPRPALGRQLWHIGRSGEFKAHFTRRR